VDLLLGADECIEIARKAKADITDIERACQLIKDNLGELSFENKRKALEVLGVKVWLDVGNVAIEGNIPVTRGAIESTLSLRHVNGKSLPMSGLYLAQL